MANSFTKLKEGDWGVRIESHVPQDGEYVTVETKAGQQKKVKVGKVVWTGANRFGPGTVSLCTIEQADSQDRAPAQPAPAPVPPVKREAVPPPLAPRYNPDDDLPF